MSADIERQIVAAEQKWRELYDAHERRSAPANYRAMEDAYDVLNHLKNEIDQCWMVGCRNIDHQYGYCPDHRGWARGFGKDVER